MKVNIRRSAAGIGAFALAGGLLLGLAAPALAATAPPWVAGEQAAHENSGGITFYDASGNQIYAGSTSGPLAAFVVASGGLPGASTAGAGVTAYLASPNTGDASGWFSDTISSAAAVPYAGALPASLAAKQTAGQLVVPVQLGYSDYLGDGAPSTYPSFTDTYEVRIVGSDVSTWYTADIKISSDGNTWTEVFPDTPAPKDNTSVTITSPTSGTQAPSGTTSVNVTGTLSDVTNPGTIPTGSVHLFDGLTDLGAATVDGSGAVSKTASVADGGSYSFTFQYTPTGNFNASTSAAVAYSVHGAASATTVTVNGSTTGTVGSPQTYTATVAPAGATGTVQFFLDGSALGTPKSVAAAASSGVSYTPADTSPHSITASFTSSDPSNFASQPNSNTVTVTASGATYQPDPQNVQVTVPAGTKTISTPYTANHPLDLGTLQLAADGTHYFTDPVNFGDPAVAAVLDPHGNLDAGGIATNGVTITDTEAGSTGWTAHLVGGDFTSGPNSIDGSLLEFTNVAPKYISGNHISTTNPVTTTPVPNVKAGGDFAKISGAAGTGVGTVAITGQLDLHDVPTSTLTDTYTTTLTFTIS